MRQVSDSVRLRFYFSAAQIDMRPPFDADGTCVIYFKIDFSHTILKLNI